LDKNFVRFKRLWSKTKLLKKFPNKGRGLQGLSKLLKKLQETGTMTRRSGVIESIQNISSFSVL